MTAEADDEVWLAGIHAPRFRGDTPGQLIFGAIWGGVSGVFGVVVATTVGHWIPLVWTVLVWGWAVFLFFRWKRLRDGVTVLLARDGYAQYPRNSEPGALRPWREGLEVNFTRTRGVWHLDVMKGVFRDMSASLQDCSDEKIALLAGKLKVWQNNPVFVEKIS